MREPGRREKACASVVSEKFWPQLTGKMGRVEVAVLLLGRFTQTAHQEQGKANMHVGSYGALNAL